MLEELTHDTFAGRLGETFRVRGQGERTVELDLIEADPVGQPIPGASRRPFSLVFRGPADVLLAQGNYHFEHGELGSLTFLIVPIGPDAEGLLYQAIFG